MVGNRAFNNITAMDANAVAKGAYNALQADRARVILPTWSMIIYEGPWRLLSIRSRTAIASWGLRP